MLKCSETHGRFVALPFVRRFVPFVPRGMTMQVSFRERPGVLLCVCMLVLHGNVVYPARAPWHKRTMGRTRGTAIVFCFGGTGTWVPLGVQVNCPGLGVWGHTFNT